jgi:hypothetical protein
MMGVYVKVDRLKKKEDNTIMRLANVCYSDPA